MKRSPRAAVASRRLVLLSGLVSALLVVVVAVNRPAFLAPLDDRVQDAVMRWARVDPPTGRIVIVNVDERSLSAIGQWPWRRDLIGRFISRLRELGAAVIALDIVFAEPDRYESSTDAGDLDRGEQRSSLTGPTGPDTALADTLRAGNVVLGYALTFEASAGDARACVLHPLGLAIARPASESANIPLFRASGAICSLPSLAQAAGASGFLNAVPDADGILRRVPLLMEYNGRVYPSLTLATVMKATGAREIALRVANANTASLIVGSRPVPLDGKGNLLLRYRGKKKTFAAVSAADVIYGQPAPDTFKDKVVFVGATASGVRNVVTTPLGTLFTGVEVQATAADNLLRQDFISRGAEALILEAVAALGLGLAVTLSIARAGPAWGSLGAVACIAAVWFGAGFALSLESTLLSPLVPTLGVIAAFAAATVATIGHARRRAETAVRQAEQAMVEKDGAQRLMVHSLLSLTEVRDTETGRHSRRTQHYAKLLAEQLSTHHAFHDYLTPERIDLMASLSPLHDIGKVGVPDRLLNKPGHLTGEEFEEMKKHPSYGRDVIVKAEQQVGIHDDVILAMAKDIVYTHHEWWNGCGYPRGLQGEQIPIAGRMVALVDMYDALTTTRAYRAPMSHDAAVALIADGRGTHFDPAVVDAFLLVAPAFRDISVEHFSDHLDRLPSGLAQI